MGFRVLTPKIPLISQSPKRPSPNSVLHRPHIFLPNSKADPGQITAPLALTTKEDYSQQRRKTKEPQLVGITFLLPRLCTKKTQQKKKQVKDLLSHCVLWAK